ncbi:MAG: acyl-CoA dehydrogenase [Desulfobacteraceae bacterium]|nr:acyl-CoA dehydrogenase [Desulfobacteraceae bacterium]
MAQLIADRRDIDFVLHEQLNVETLSREERFNEFGKKTVDLIVSEARNLAIKEMLPLQKPSDAGCRFDNGLVKVPEGFHRVMAAYNDGEWLAMTDDPEWGGQGMPKTVAMAANEYFYGACNSFMLYNLLTHGAAKLVENFGTREQKELHLEKMLSGKWAGTMLLTEPEAGSDLACITTTARDNGDGTYSLTGNKIFISGGEQDLTENIVHPVLARLEDAPPGIKGISLFLVTKYRLKEDGTPGEFNHVVCTGIEEKMGLHGSATCSLELGGKGQCTGTLLGEKNKGMAAMFLMMNEARQMVGLQGQANASASYMYALDYARQRIQSKKLTAPAGSAPASIINHPDVKRQLLMMKAWVDGMRSLVYYTGLCHDREAIATDEAEKHSYATLLEVLTPIVKGYITDRAFDVCNHGVQIYGGYGFIEEFPVSQLLRDSRIFMLYEGTNGIQSMDLVGRKLGMDKGKPFIHFLAQVEKTLAAAKQVPGLIPMAESMERFLAGYAEVAHEISQRAAAGKVMEVFAFSHPFLEVTGDLTMAWMLLWRATVAYPKLGKTKKDDGFYHGQVRTARFFINNILPITTGRLNAIKQGDAVAAEMEDAWFGGK